MFLKHLEIKKQILVSSKGNVSQQLSILSKLLYIFV